jgi:hypothetical protein
MATAANRRTGTRSATKATPAAATKAAPAKATTAKAETAPAATDDRPRTVVQMIRLDDTKRYSKWAWPDDAPNGCTGNVYAPLEAEEVRVAIFGLPE